MVTEQSRGWCWFVIHGLCPHIAQEDQIISSALYVQRGYLGEQIRFSEREVPKEEEIRELGPVLSSILLFFQMPLGVATVKRLPLSMPKQLGNSRLKAPTSGWQR